MRGPDSSNHVVWKMPASFSGQELPAWLRGWLLDAGSFTQRILSVKKPDQCYRIEIINETLEIAKKHSLEDTLFLCRYMYVREILIYLGSDLLMFARSVIPKNAPLLLKNRFRKLGQRPLGELLFSTSAIQRSSFELAKFRAEHREFKLAVTDLCKCPLFLWGRRSVFLHSGAVLLLTEVFSPNLMRLIRKSETTRHR